MGPMTHTATSETSKRGRPSLARAEALDRLVIDTAREMFLAEGFDAVAMEQVAAAARISKGTLYARHASKESLFNAVVEATIRQWAAEAALEDARTSDAIEARLRHHAYTVAASMLRADVRAFQRLVLSVRDRFPDVARSMYAQGYRYIVGLVEDDIRLASKNDGMPVKDALAVAELLVASITGRQLQDVEPDPTGARLHGFAMRTVDLLLASRSSW